MGWHDKLAAVFVTTVAVASSTALQAQGVGKYLAPKDQVIAIRAGRLFDAKSGSILNNQVVLVRGATSALGRGTDSRCSLVRSRSCSPRFARTEPSTRAPPTSTSRGSRRGRPGGGARSTSA